MSKGKIYLAGSMEFAPDGGVGWRHIAKHTLRSYGWEVFDPTESEYEVLHPFGIMTASEFLGLKKTGCAKDFILFQKVMRSIIQFDVKELQSSDVLLALIDPFVSGGTAGEITLVHVQGRIPIIGVVTSEIADTSGWVLSCLDRIFTNLPDALTFISNKEPEELQKEVKWQD